MSVFLPLESELPERRQFFPTVVCCILWPVFGCCTLQTLVKIWQMFVSAVCIFYATNVKRCWNAKKIFWTANGMQSTHFLVKIHNSKASVCWLKYMIAIVFQSYGLAANSNCIMPIIFYQGLILPTKKVRKISRIPIQFLIFWKMH